MIENVKELALRNSKHIKKLIKVNETTAHALEELAGHNESAAKAYMKASALIRANQLHIRDAVSAGEKLEEAITKLQEAVEGLTKANNMQALTIIALAKHVGISDEDLAQSAKELMESKDG